MPHLDTQQPQTRPCGHWSPTGTDSPCPACEAPNLADTLPEPPDGTLLVVETQPAATVRLLRVLVRHDEPEDPTGCWYFGSSTFETSHPMPWRMAMIGVVSVRSVSSAAITLYVAGDESIALQVDGGA